MVWGFGVFLKHITWYVTTSQFIPTDDKEELIKSLRTTHEKLVDAERRAAGEIPVTPRQEKEWRERINQARRNAGQEPLKE